MQPCPYPIEKLLYHAPPMILIDGVKAYDDETVVSFVTIEAQSPFLRQGKMPAYVGIEYMAQSIAAYSGIKALNEDGEIKIGYLVSARKMEMSQPDFAFGEQLEITVKLVYNESPMAVFDCSIKSGDDIVATARLNVYQP